MYYVAVWFSVAGLIAVGTVTGYIIGAYHSHALGRAWHRAGWLVFRAKLWLAYWRPFAFMLCHRPTRVTVNNGGSA